MPALAAYMDNRLHCGGRLRIRTAPARSSLVMPPWPPPPSPVRLAGAGACPAWPPPCGVPPCSAAVPAAAALAGCRPSCTHPPCLVALRPPGYIDPAMRRHAVGPPASPAASLLGPRVPRPHPRRRNGTRSWECTHCRPYRSRRDSRLLGMIRLHVRPPGSCVATRFLDARPALQTAAAPTRAAVSRNGRAALRPARAIGRGAGRRRACRG